MSASNIGSQQSYKRNRSIKKVEEDLEDYDANDYENEDNMRVGENVRIFGDDREDRNREDINRED